MRTDRVRGALAVWDDTKGVGNCRSCGQRIWWFTLTTGKKHPFDEDPVYVKTETDPDTRRIIAYIDLDITPSHFQTCPDPNNWRRK